MRPGRQAAIVVAVGVAPEGIVMLVTHARASLQRTLEGTGSQEGPSMMNRRNTRFRSSGEAAIPPGHPRGSRLAPSTASGEPPHGEREAASAPRVPWRQTGELPLLRVSGKEVGAGIRSRGALRHGLRNRWRRVAFVSVGVVLPYLCELPTAWAAPKSPLVVSVAPSSLPVVSSGAVTFTFTAVDQGTGRVMLVVPNVPVGTHWAAPQITDNTQSGFVAVIGSTCNVAVPAAVSGDGPWTVTVDFKCARGKSFSLVYGATAPSLAGAHAFATSVSTGREFLPVSTQPVVTVTAGPAAALDFAGLVDASAGTTHAATLTARDAYGNVATSYRGTVGFASSDAQATLPGATSFGADDNGVRAVNVTLGTAGAQTVTATDSANELSDEVMVTIAPGAATAISVVVTDAGGYLAFFKRGGLGLPGPNCGASPVDAYGNLGATLSGSLQWTSTDLHASLPATAPFAPPGAATCDFGTAGAQVLTVASTSNPAIHGSVTVTVIGPIPYADELTFLNPTHTGHALYTISPLFNDSQTAGLTGSVILGRFRNKVRTVTQPVYTGADGNTYQVGVLSISAEGFAILWNLNPPADVEGTDGATLLRCPVMGAACMVEAPIAARYTIFDGVNESAPAALTLRLETPANQPVTASDTFVLSGDGSAVTLTTTGSSSITLPLYTNLSATLTSTANPNEYSATIAYPVCTQEGCITQSATGTITAPDLGTLSGTQNVQLLSPAVGSGSSLSVTNYSLQGSTAVTMQVSQTAANAGEIQTARIAAVRNVFAN
jgi:hypothetical protein